jgi:hypothetical protein
MAYNTEELYKKAIKEIDKKKLFFVSDVISVLPCSKSRFYDFFPDGSDELDNIKEKLDENRIIMKVSIRQKLHKGDNTTSLLALYKLICTDDERKALSQTYQDVAHSGQVNIGTIKLKKASESGS